MRKDSRNSRENNDMHTNAMIIAENKVCFNEKKKPHSAGMRLYEMFIVRIKQLDESDYAFFFFLRITQTTAAASARIKTMIATGKALEPPAEAAPGYERLRFVNST